jgi:kynureninase
MKTATRRDPETDLLRWRKEFPILKHTTYLVSHSMGAMPKTAFDRLRQYGEEWAEDGLEAYDHWVPRLRDTADLIGSLFGAPKGSVAMHQNVSTLTAIVLSAIQKPGGRTKVVYTDLNFPSIHYNWFRHQELGLRVHLVTSPDGIEIPTEKMIEAIDEETLAVVVDHGIFRSGYLQDVAAIAKAARAKGAYTFVDAYQTVGCVPIDVTEWGIDFLVGGSHKWLCGGPGAAYLYVRPALIPQLQPRITGWFSHRQPFAFEWDLVYAEDAMRFATGTPNMPGIHAARAGIEIVAHVGVAKVREKSVRLTQKLIAAAEEEGLKVNSPKDPARRSGLVCIDFPGADRAEGELLRRGFHVDYRPRCGLRLSAHFYTKEAELLSVLPEIRKIRKKK